MRGWSRVGIAAAVSVSLLMSSSVAAIAEDATEADQIAELIDRFAPGSDVVAQPDSEDSDSIHFVAGTGFSKASSADGTAGQVSVPVDAEGSVVLRNSADTVLEVSLPKEIEVNDAELSDSGTVVYSDAGGGAHAAVQTLDGGGVRLQTVLQSGDAPDEYTYVFGEGVELDVQDTGYVLAFADGELVGILDPAWAIDANGNDVPTRYVSDGSELSQIVETGEATAFPVTADPTIRLCTAGQHGDYAHITAGQVSAHGWWTFRADTAKCVYRTAKAKVSIKLQYKDKSSGGRTVVRTFGPVVKTRAAGRGKSANIRKTCLNQQSRQWRSIVDVDILGVLDTPMRTYTPWRTLKCGL